MTRHVKGAAFASLTAALLTFAAAAQAEELSIATGGTGGVYYPYGGGVAEIIGQHVPGATASVEVTGASVENIALIQRGESDIALVQADTAFQAFNGVGRFDGAGVPELRALMSIYPNVIHLVTLADSGIETLEDLRGKPVSVGAPGSGTEVSVQQILAANGITYEDFDAQRLNFNETADALRDGVIVAGFWNVGPPTSSIMNLAATRAIRILPIEGAALEAALAAEPTFAAYTMRAGMYDGMTDPVQTVSMPNVMIVSADFDEELAYQITKAIYDNIADLIAVHPAANDTTVEFSVNATSIPFHPGALRYLEEIGATIQDRQRP